MPVIHRDTSCFLSILAGLALLLWAWPAASGLSMRAEQIIYELMAGAWGLVFIGSLMCAKRGGLTQNRFTLGLPLGIFILSLLPLQSRSYQYLIAFNLSVGGFLLLGAGLLCWKRIHPLMDGISRQIAGMKNISPFCFITIFFTAFLAITIFLSWYCHAFLPVVLDTIAQYVHAKFMAQGRLFGDSEPLRDFFDFSMSINDGKWYSHYNPLQIFLISLGHRAHMPWLVAPLEGACTLLAIYALTRRIFGEATARLAVILFLASPFVLFMSSEYMSHVGALLFITLFVLCYVHMLENGNLLWAITAGFCLGAVFLIRPLSAVGAALPYLLYSLYLVASATRRYLLPITLMAIGPIVCIIFQGWYNLQTTGHPFLFPYVKNGYWIQPVFSQGYTLADGLLKMVDEWNRMNIALFGWFFRSIFFVLLYCLSSFRNLYARLLYNMVGSFTLINILNRYPSNMWGPRFIYETISALIILSAAGIMQLPILVRSFLRNPPSAAVIQGSTVFVILVIFIGGWIYRLPEDMEKYLHKPQQGDPAFYFSLLAQAKSPALVFIEFSPHTEWEDKYEYVAFTNPPASDAPVIFARDLGLDKDHKLMDYYPHRNAYLERAEKLYPLP